MKISWSALQTFLSCQRKFELSYIERLQKKPGIDKRNLIRGSAFHKGIEGALWASMMTQDPVGLVEAAVWGAKKYIESLRVPGLTVYNWKTRQEEPNDDYYNMLDELLLIIPELLRYHVPLIGLGSRYEVCKRIDVLGDAWEGVPDVQEDWQALAVEWEFKHYLNDEDYLSGIIDTVLWDKQEEEFVLVDWKTREQFPMDFMALLDGQLHLYAGVLNAMGANITRVAMWQFLTHSPKPASISVKKGVPNTGAASYDTTWEQWIATLPFGVDPKKYEKTMRPKMKTDADFQRVVIGQVTATSSKLMFDNVYAALHSIKAAQGMTEATDLTFPAVLGSSACKYCEFAKLCANGFRYGGDVTEVLERDYQIKPNREVEENDREAI